MKRTISVIGAGFSGLATAALLAKEGHNVRILEKNETIGGRARQFSENGFTFDMGPSWYWMPDVFERYYNIFGYKTEDLYELKRLTPSYRVIFGQEDIVDIPSDLDHLYKTFEELEPGSSAKLKQFLKEAEYKYDVGVKELVFKPGHSFTEYLDSRVIGGLFKLHMLKDFSSYVKKYFKSPKIRQILEFPVLFLGAMPDNIPALYSMMNYADIVLGTWYPMGGMHKIVQAMEKIAKEQGVEIHTSTPVDKIVTENKTAKQIISGNQTFEQDFIVSSADYHHTEESLLEPSDRNYNEKYWSKRTFAPSCLLYYIGVDKKINNLKHHNLFFDTDFQNHAEAIYKDPSWPSSPLFYVCTPSKTDNSVAPDGKENMFILIPVAPGLEDNQEIKDKYFELTVKRIEERTGVNFKDDIVYRRDYGVSNFIKDYNAYGGNAYGLANTLRQTGFLKPKIANKKVKNLFYTGQLTVPGPGVPPALISGQIIAKELKAKMK